MGVIGAKAATRLTTYAGHTFGWRLAAAGADECRSEDLEGTVTIAEGMERHVLGEAPVVKDLKAEEREIVVTFNADVVDGMPWRFFPTQRSIRLK